MHLRDDNADEHIFKPAADTVDYFMGPGVSG